ncbi:MAG: ureidoglycolate lyase [Labrys sp. (in: a-proteobacteria)]|jgi:ureidoglycolate lyase
MTTETRPVHTLPVEPLTAEAFAPFGVVLSPRGRERLPINTYGDRLNLFREGFETDQPIEWFIVEGHRRPMQALFLERHRQLTQAFIPMNGDGFVTIVARPDAQEHYGMIALAEMRAFHVPGDAAIQIHRGTWHENPFPLRDGQWFLVTSHAALTLGHQKNPSHALQGLPLDLERRWFKDAAFDVRTDAA